MSPFFVQINEKMLKKRNSMLGLVSVHFFFIKGPINIESHIYKATISKLERTFETRQEMTPKSRGG